MHFLPEAHFELLKLIEYFKIHYNINPNRVSVIGYSAGGDGVYHLGCNLADKLCFSCACAGHPNGCLMENALPCRFWVQQGM